MKRVLTAVCCFALVSMPLLAQKTAMTKGAMTDQQFVDLAAQIDMVEANLGQLAQTNAESQAVKDYANMLVTDHTSDYQQLKNAAQEANLTVPTAIDAEHNKVIAQFQKLKGAAFDHRYIQEMVAGHTKAIETTKKVAENAENPAIKSYAQTAMPTLEKHLDGAKNLEMQKSK